MGLQQKRGTQGTAECVTDVLITLWFLCDQLYNVQSHATLESLCLFEKEA